MLRLKNRENVPSDGRKMALIYAGHRDPETLLW